MSNIITGPRFNACSITSSIAKENCSISMDRDTNGGALRHSMLRDDKTGGGGQRPARNVWRSAQTFNAERRQDRRRWSAPCSKCVAERSDIQC
jgi:hypothetical protein